MSSKEELQRQKLIAAALKRKEKLELATRFDASRPGTEPTTAQDKVFQDMGKVTYRYIVAGNQAGKTQTGARELAWILADNHPHWVKPKEWQREPLLCLMACQDMSIGEQIWNERVLPFLNPSEWKSQKQGQVLKSVTNTKTGDKVIFLSHSKGADESRKHMQSYTAHFVWLDEMPSSIKVLEELQRRVDAKRGYLIATFTPKVRNDAIRKVVDSSIAPIAKKYRMGKLDNPIYADRKDEEIAKLTGYPEAMKKTILFGEWAAGDESVYYWDRDYMVVDKLPDAYGPQWRHVVSVDPALRSKAGFALFAEDPVKGVWYLINDKYVEGSQTLVAGELLEQIEKRIQGYNIVRRISDTMPYFVAEASKRGLAYMTPYQKNSRKEELIKGLQTQLSTGKLKIAKWCESFIDEIQSCRFAENSDRLVNSSSYHTLDSAQYFCDNMPATKAVPDNTDYYARIRAIDEQHTRQKHMQEKLSKENSQSSRERKSIKHWNQRIRRRWR